MQGEEEEVGEVLSVRGGQRCQPTAPWQCFALIVGKENMLSMGTSSSNNIAHSVSVSASAFLYVLTMREGAEKFAPIIFFTAQTCQIGPANGPEAVIVHFIYTRMYPLFHGPDMP